MHRLRSKRHAWHAMVLTFKRGLCLLAILGGGSAAMAAVVSYEATSLGDNQWRYDYVVQGQAPTGGFDGVTIYFNAGLFGALQNAVVPAEWDPLLVQVDLGIPADGLLDLLSLSGPLTGSIVPLSFSVEVEYLGNGMPGAQNFALYVFDPFSTLETGFTQPLNAEVPEPASLALVCAALAAAAMTRRERRTIARRQHEGTRHAGT